MNDAAIREAAMALAEHMARRLSDLPSDQHDALWAGVTKFMSAELVRFLGQSGRLHAALIVTTARGLVDAGCDTVQLN